jgi:hypothetical protein
MTKRFIRPFTSLSGQERKALITIKEAEFRERLALALEALAPATKPLARGRP